MSWLDLYWLIRQMTTKWRLGGRACFAALVSAFLYHERFHSANAVDHLARTRRFKRRQAYRKIEKFLQRKTMHLDSVWQWLWDHYTAQLKDCFVLVDWTMWKDGRQVLMAALAHAGRCLPFFAVAYQVQKILRSQNQAEHAFFSLLSLFKRAGQQITCINDRGFARISLIKQLRLHDLHFITRVCHNTYFASDKYCGLLRDYVIQAGGLMDQVEVSPSLISTVTDAVIDEVRAWQGRPLEALYLIVYFDCLMVKVREGAHIQNKAIYLAVGLTREGQKEALGLWISPTEGAKFWLGVVSELKNRGVADIFIACVDGLVGLPEAIEAVFPQVQVQQCVVHQVRASLKYVGYKERKAVAADLRAIYTAPTREQGERQLKGFADKWDRHYPMISKQWSANWERLAVFYGYPPAIRKVIYTTNSIESVNDSLRRVIKNRGSFPSDEAALKLIYLALDNISRKWTRPVPDWQAALNQFAILFEERLPLV